VRGLPPPPPDVAQLTAAIDNDGARSSVTTWVQLLPGPPYSIADLKGVLGDLTIALTTLVNQLSTFSTTVRTCRLRTFGIETWDIIEAPAFNSGAFTGSQANHVATCIHWLTGESGKRGPSLMRIPGFPDVFTNDHLSLTAGAIGTVYTEATTFINQVDAITFGDILGVSVGTLHRSRHGAPLAVAQFTPYVGGRADPFIARVSRRLYLGH